jgi:hypothetical protein
MEDGVIMERERIRWLVDSFGAGLSQMVGIFKDDIGYSGYVKVWNFLTSSLRTLHRGESICKLLSALYISVLRWDVPFFPSIWLWRQYDNIHLQSCQGLRLVVKYNGPG